LILTHTRNNLPLGQIDSVLLAQIGNGAIQAIIGCRNPSLARVGLGKLPHASFTKSL
jgi:hypothetical protein